MTSRARREVTELFRGAAAYREASRGPDHSPRGYFHTAPDSGGRGATVPGRGRTLPDDPGAVGTFVPRRQRKMYRDSMFELLEWWNKDASLSGADLGNPAPSVRVDPSVCGREPARTGRAHRAVGSCIGAASTPTTFSRWMSTTGKIVPATTLRYKLCARRARIYVVAGIHGRRTCADTGAGLETHPAPHGKNAGERSWCWPPRQEQLLDLLRAQGSMSPAEIWAALLILQAGRDGFVATAG